MSYQALARKYRPQTFSDIIGQETVVRTLQNAIEQKRIHHAYLFSGVRGVGKTTAARILAKALNCVKGPAAEPCNECTICREITEGIDMDVREIDAATYTGVDNIRELRDVTQFQPARDRYRIFIIDEAHMLSTASWNALLKIHRGAAAARDLHVRDDGDATKSRRRSSRACRKFMLRKITLDELIARLRQICECGGDRGRRAARSRSSRGAAKEACATRCRCSIRSSPSADAPSPPPTSPRSSASPTPRSSRASRRSSPTAITAAILEALEEAAESGRDFKMLYRDLLSFMRNLLLVAGGANESMLAVAPEDLPVIRTTAEKFSYSELLRIANLLLRDDETVNRAEHQRLAVEIALLKAATFPRLRAVEEALAGGAAIPRAAAPRASRGRGTESRDRADAAKRDQVRPQTPPSNRSSNASRKRVRSSAATSARRNRASATATSCCSRSPIHSPPIRSATRGRRSNRSPPKSSASR